jgi:hypothetical protein
MLSSSSSSVSLPLAGTCIQSYRQLAPTHQVIVLSTAKRTQQERCCNVQVLLLLASAAAPPEQVGSEICTAS